MKMRIAAVALATAALLATSAAATAKPAAHKLGGTLKVVAWEGYTEAQWVAPFEKATGCKVQHQYAGGKYYGLPWQWGPNVLMWNTAKYTGVTNSWSALYDPANKGKITIPNNPIQIADAALYLSKTKPALGIKDPYELTSDQLNAAVALLKTQRPLIKAYWGFATDEVKNF